MRCGRPLTALTIHVYNLSLDRYSSNKAYFEEEVNTTFPGKRVRSIAGLLPPRREELSHLETYMLVLGMIAKINKVKM
jgi:hypothetical protein